MIGLLSNAIHGRYRKLHNVLLIAMHITVYMVLIIDLKSY